ncbi:MAG: hypothetical protein ABH856_01130 [Patescibacteria group bacterium]
MPDVIDETSRSFIMRDLALGKEVPVVEKDSVFWQTSDFVAELAEKYGGNMDLFKDEGFCEKFLSDFTRFKRRLAEGMGKLRILVVRNRHAEFFPEGWDSRLERCMYLAFFVHYGAKRRAERDKDTGEPLDYIYHVMRSTFSDYAEKIGMLNEEATNTMALHDVFEDLGIGILGEKGFDIPEERMGEIARDVDEFICDVTKDGLNGGRYLRKYLQILTKDPVMKHRSRVRCSFDLIADVAESFVRTDNIEELIPLLLKNADNLDNHPSISVSQKPDEDRDSMRIRMIRDEINFFWISLCGRLGACNAKEWNFDFEYFVDPRKRQEAYGREVMLREESERGDIKDAFYMDFHFGMMKEVPGIDGADYWIESRPRSLGRRSIVKGSEIETKRGREMHLQGFNHYIIFTCLNDDRSGEISAAARKVFEGIFSRPVPKRYYGVEKKAAFGSKFTYGRDPENYGAGAWRVCDTRESSERTFYGRVHAAYHHDDRECRDELRQFFRKLSIQINDLRKESAILDEIYEGDVTHAVRSTRGLVASNVSPQRGTDARNYCPQLVDNPEGRDRLFELLEKRMLTIFAVKYPVTVSINEGRNLEVVVPDGTDIGCALLYESAFRTCQKIKSVTLCRGGKEEVFAMGESGHSLVSVLKKELREGDVVKFAIDEKSDFDYEAVGMIRNSMDQRVLRNHKKQILK